MASSNVVKKQTPEQKARVLQREKRELKAHLQDKDAAHEAGKMRRGSILFDPSGGRGILPYKWPPAPLNTSMGYAGGITPYDVRSVVAEIIRDSDCRCGDFWIDMESGVRTADRFDLAKVHPGKTPFERSKWGRKVARLCNVLDMRNDAARHFGLGLGITAEEKQKARDKLKIKFTDFSHFLGNA